MPHITAVIDDRGPVITVHIGVSAQRAAALRAAGGAVPQYITCNLLIDTGASITCIDPSFIHTLGINPTGSIPIHTPSTGTTPHAASTYDVSLIMTGGGQPKLIGALPVVACDFNAQAIDGLLGRDVLGTSRMVYSGHDNLVMLSTL